jgi:hypothetical protein
VYFSLIRPGASENDQKTAKTLKTVSDTFTEIETFTVSLINSPFNTFTLTCLKRAHVVTSFSGLTTANEKFKAYRAHAKVSANARFLAPVNAVLSTENTCHLLWIRRLLSAALFFAHAKNVAVLNELCVNYLLQGLHLCEKSAIFQSNFAMAMLLGQ